VISKEIFMRGSILLRVLASAAVAMVLTGSSPAQGAKVTQLHSFDRRTGAKPVYSALVQGWDGLLYGTTAYGGIDNIGAIFRIDTSGKITLLHSFSGSDGSYPWGGLTLGLDGNFYGGTALGGAGGSGVLFKVTPTGSYTILHEFLNYATGGGGAYSPPILAADGSFYGVTDFGGAQNAGVLYKITSAGQFNVIYSYTNATGSSLDFAPVQGSNGNLYVVALTGGANSCGSITEVSPSGVLLNEFSFDCGTGGEYPSCNAVQGADGYFYGTADQGATDNGGVLFKVDENLDYTVLQDFGAIAGGGTQPEAPLVLATDRNLYGLTYRGGSQSFGTIYGVTPDGNLNNILSWPAKVEAQAAMVQHTNGTLYGVTYGGGTFGLGTVYSLNLGLGPFVTFVGGTGKPGQTAEILGQGLTGTTSVTFNGVPATSFTVVEDTYMTAVVPAGATTGPLVVTTPTQTLTSNKNFRISN
jgi:uncharacterized repeat protein (TIGR03803 family)